MQSWQGRLAVALFIIVTLCFVMSIVDTIPLLSKRASVTSLMERVTEYLNSPPTHLGSTHNPRKEYLRFLFVLAFSNMHLN